MLVCQSRLYFVYKSQTCERVDKRKIFLSTSLHVDRIMFSRQL